MLPVTAVKNSVPWFAHYSPRRPVPPLSAETARQFIKTVHRPLRDQNSISSLWDAASAVSPTFQNAVRNLRETGTQFVLVNDPEPYWTLTTDHRPTIFLPGNHLPIGCFASLLSIIGSVIPPPEGMTPPPRKFHTSASNFRENYLQIFRWLGALGRTFLYQFVDEMVEGGVSLPIPGLGAGILRPVDIALFQILRERGISGLAGVITDYADPEVLDKIRGRIAHQTTLIAVGGIVAAADRVWEPPTQEASPAIPQTFLDKLADRALRWGKGLYRKDHVSPLDSDRIAEMRTQLEGRVETTEDVHHLIALIGELAPRLATSLLEPVNKGQVPLKLIDQPSSLGVGPALPIPTWFGLPSSVLPRLCVHRRVKKGEAMSALVMALATAGVPEELLQEGRLGRQPDEDHMVNMVRTYLTYRYYCRISWGLSALLEFIWEAGSAGMEIPLSESGRRAGDYLERFNLLMLIERVQTIWDPDLSRRDLSDIDQWTRIALKSGILPDLIRHQNGEEVGEERLLEMSKILSTAFEQNRSDVAALPSAGLLLGESPEPPRRPPKFEKFRGLVEEIAGQFGRLPKSIQRGAEPVGIALRHLKHLLGWIENGKIELRPGRQLIDFLLPHLLPAAGQTEVARLSPAVVEILGHEVSPQGVPGLIGRSNTVSPDGDLLAGLRSAAEGITANRRRERQEAREAADRDREQARQRREAEAREAAERARREAETRESTQRESHKRLFQGYLDLLGQLIGKIEIELPKLVSRGLVRREMLGSIEIAVTVSGNGHTIPLRPAIEAKAATLRDSFDQRLKDPLLNIGATAGPLEQLEALVKLVNDHLFILQRLASRP